MLPWFIHPSSIISFTPSICHFSLLFSSRFQNSYLLISLPLIVSRPTLHDPSSHPSTLILICRWFCHLCCYHYYSNTDNPRAPDLLQPRRLTGSPCTRLVRIELARLRSLPLSLIMLFFSLRRWGFFSSSLSFFVVVKLYSLVAVRSH